MKNEKLVSVITPCYNGENFVHRFFQNILEQTYSKIELIFVDDGSTDRTGEIAKSYIRQFENRGMKLRYIYQKNAGQAAAVNQGLSIFQGEYLMWTDADDILAPENTEKKVRYLESHPDVGIVMCQGRKVKEENISVKTEDYSRIMPKGEDHFFEDLLVSRNVVFTPGIYMVRRELVLKAFPERKILVSRIGQNFQMLLPMAYLAKCGYIHEELFSYVIREDSHSNAVNTMEAAMQRDSEHEKVVLALLDEIEPADKNRYIKMVHAKYMRARMDNAYHFKNKKVIKQKYREMKECGYAARRDTLIYLSGICPPVNWAYHIFLKAKKIKYAVEIKREQKRQKGGAA